MKYFFKILFKLSYVPCYGRNVTKLIFTVLISATLGTFNYGYLVTTTLQRDRLSCAANGVTIECLQYLAEPCVNDLSLLNKYITVKRLFRRLNTAVRSSAAVERLFSKGALISTRCNRLGDEHFQKLLLLNANKQ